MSLESAGPLPAAAVRARFEALRRAAEARRQPPSVTGWLWLRELQLAARLGVGEDERHEPQPLVLSLGLKVDLGAAAAADALEATVDWAEVARQSLALAARRPWHLAETLALALAEATLDHPQVLQVQCELTKPGCLPSGHATVSVRLRRPRPGGPRRGRGRDLGQEGGPL